MKARLLALSLLLLAGCKDYGAFNRVPRDNAYDSSSFFPDGKVMRPLPEGTVPQEALASPLPLSEGRTPEGGWRPEVPLPVTKELYAKGRSLFDIHCAACHGLLADGDSVAAENMPLRRPPDLMGAEEWAHAAEQQREDGGMAGPRDALLPHPPGYYFAVITHGFGMMRSYAAQLGVEERWAVVAYLRALALARRAPLAAAPPEVQERLEKEAP